MNNKNSKFKKRLRTIIILSVIALIIAGGAVGMYFYSQAQIVVDVFPLYTISTPWNNSTPTPGTISTDVTQRVYLTPSDTVEEILVEEGALVQKGDTLISYDTTLLDLQVEISGLNVAITKTRIANKEKELANFKKTYASLLESTALAEAPPPPSPAPSELPEPSLSVSADEPPTPSPSASSDEVPSPSPSASLQITIGNENEIPVPYRHIDIDSKAYSGTGTEEQPFRYFISSGATIDSKFIVELATQDREEPLYLVLEMRKDNLFSGSVMTWFHITIKPDGNFEYQLRLSPDLAPFDPAPASPPPSGSPEEPPIEEPIEPPTEEPTESPTPTPTATPTPTPTKTPTPAPTVPVYSKEEAQRLYAEMQKDLTNMKLDLRQLEINHTTSTRRLESGTVKSNINGRVVSVLDVDTSIITSQPVVIVSGGEGYYVSGTVSELDLDRVEVGQAVTVRSWAFEAVGEIVEIGIYPATDDPYFPGSANISFYPITVYVGPEYDLSNEYYAEIYPHFDEGASADGLGALYIDRAFVMPAEGANSPYVYVSDPENEDRLKKVEVQTGQLLWGSYIEVRAGLTGDEYLAFPYDKNVKDGVNTQVQESIYNYY